jgi:hypothetical protein
MLIFGNYLLISNKMPRLGALKSIALAANCGFKIPMASFSSGSILSE